MVIRLNVLAIAIAAALGVSLLGAAYATTPSSQSPPGVITTPPRVYQPGSPTAGNDSTDAGPSTGLVGSGSVITITQAPSSSGSGTPGPPPPPPPPPPPAYPGAMEGWYGTSGFFCGNLSCSIKTPMVGSNAISILSCGGGLLAYDVGMSGTWVVATSGTFGIGPVISPIGMSPTAVAQAQCALEFP